MNVALAFICLSNEEVGDVPANMVFVADGIAAKDFLEAGAVCQWLCEESRRCVQKRRRK